MRKSANKHPLAVLRQIIGLDQPQMAKLLGVSLSIIASVESGRRKLSEKLAQEISAKTGASFKWLIRGDPTEAPKGGKLWSEPYTKDMFRTAMADTSAEYETRSEQAKDYLWGVVHEMAEILMCAYQYKKLNLVKFKISNALNSIRNELDLKQRYTSVLQNAIPFNVEVPPGSVSIQRAKIELDKFNEFIDEFTRLVSGSPKGAPPKQ